MGMSINNGDEDGDGDRHILLRMEYKFNWIVLPGVIINVIRGTLC